MMLPGLLLFHLMGSGAGADIAAAVAADAAQRHVIIDPQHIARPCAGTLRHWWAEAAPVLYLQCTGDAPWQLAVRARTLPAASAAAAPPAVRRGDAVAVLLSDPAFEVIQRGTAMHDAAIGAPLRVRITGQVLTGTVVGPGQIRIQSVNVGRDGS